MTTAHPQLQVFQQQAKPLQFQQQQQQWLPLKPPS
jgi:hypothetical protein